MSNKTDLIGWNDQAEAGVTRRDVLRTALTLVAAPVAAAVLTAGEAEAASGKIDFRLFRAGFILGVGGGEGTLTFEGKRYPLSIGGVSIGATIGVASAEFVGRVRHLRRARDIDGTYSAIGAGLAAAGGGSVARLRNSRGVELEVSGKQIGFMASIDLSGLRIRLGR